MKKFPRTFLSVGLCVFRFQKTFNRDFKKRREGAKFVVRDQPIARFNSADCVLFYLNAAHLHFSGQAFL